MKIMLCKMLLVSKPNLSFYEFLRALRAVTEGTSQPMKAVEKPANRLTSIDKEANLL
jgi:hypothetical protein